jgi:hypothetical protein
LSGGETFGGAFFFGCVLTREAAVGDGLVVRFCVGSWELTEEKDVASAKEVFSS